MSTTLPFSQVACLPGPEDNCAVAIRRLSPGTRLEFGSQVIELRSTVLEGHRFAVQRIEVGQALLSWGFPFGLAQHAIPPGGYVCNEGVLTELRTRSLDFPLPETPNLVDTYAPYAIDEVAFAPGSQVDLFKEPGRFSGFVRPHGRGTGTRNYIVIVGTTSRTASFARRLASRLNAEVAALKGIDGIVAVAHTEGGTPKRPNNLDYLTRTLAGFAVHPNVGAVLIVDDGEGPVSNTVLQGFLAREDYPLTGHLLEYQTVSGNFVSDLEVAAKRVRAWYKPLSELERCPSPLSGLRLALQCGGSDAFSGITANPLIGLVARELLRHGGSANLAETDELVGAESYVLQNVRDLATARKFLAFIAEFKERMSWHGHSPEGNPSGGNRYRGLYNIVVKSLGAAVKRAPDVRLDSVVDYSERMSEPGYYFMNSPGNDLESIAGQVASGCNLIFFTTGNGAITNFPFVPTIKVLTTSDRFQLLSDDMDVNAGASLDGIPMEVLVQDTFALAIAAASGLPTKGEKAGHHQVSIWRDWMQTSEAELPILPQPTAIRGEPCRVHLLEESTIRAVREIRPRPFDAGVPGIGLIIPTSLCSSEVAALFARRLAQSESLHGLRRIAALSHTEGCGVSGGHSQDLFVRTLLGYATHPLVSAALFLEHGCEKVHNQFLHLRLRELGVDPASYGWASIQLDGGIEASFQKVGEWFRARKVTQSEAEPRLTPTVAVASHGSLPSELARLMGWYAASLVYYGGTVLTLQGDPLLHHAGFKWFLPLDDDTQPNLSFADRPEAPGLYVMETFTAHWVENLTALGAAGGQAILSTADGSNRQGHPFLPVLRLAAADTKASEAETYDLLLEGPASTEQVDRLACLVRDAVMGSYIPHSLASGNYDFQVCRGPLGVSV